MHTHKLLKVSVKKSVRLQLSYNLHNLKWQSSSETNNSASPEIPCVLHNLKPYMPITRIHHQSLSSGKLILATPSIPIVLRPILIYPSIYVQVFRIIFLLIIKIIKPVDIIHHTCCWFMPVKQNMPIWSVICDQSRCEPSFFRLSRSCVRTDMIRSAIPFTSCNL